MKDEEQNLIDEVELENRKNAMIEKIADSLYPKQYNYLKFLNHIMTECEESLKVERGCPLPKCKAKQSMTLNQLRLHLINDCTKINMECNVCKQLMRRPWVQYHNCANVFQERLAEKDGVIKKLDSRVATIGNQLNDLK